MDVYDPREEEQLAERLEQLRTFKRRSSRARSVDAPDAGDAGEGGEADLGDELLPAAVGALLARPELLKELPAALQGAELGRMLLSGVGAALGSRHRAVGAGAGGALGSVLFDWLVEKGVLR